MAIICSKPAPWLWNYAVAALQTRRARRRAAPISAGFARGCGRFVHHRAHRANRGNAAVNRRQLRNQQRVNNREACVDAVTNLFADYDTEPLRVKLREARVPCTPVNDYAAVMADGQIDALGVIVSGEDPDYGEFKVPGLPFSISDYQPAPPKTAPRVGEHTREVLLEIGYSDEKIDRLNEVGALG